MIIYYQTSSKFNIQSSQYSSSKEIINLLYNYMKRTKLAFNPTFSALALPRNFSERFSLENRSNVSRGVLEKEISTTDRCPLQLTNGTNGLPAHGYFVINFWKITFPSCYVWRGISIILTVEKMKAIVVTNSSIIP